MVKRFELPAFLLLSFGIPFLFLTDLFPFHRFGMFAGIARNPEKTASYEIETHQNGNWKNLETGNPYFDSGYFPAMAEKAFGHPKKEKELAELLQESMKKPELRFRLRKKQFSPLLDSIRCISPNCP
jgi:hypothetical protein